MGFPYTAGVAGTQSHYPSGPSGGSPNEVAASLDDVVNAQKLDAKGGVQTIGFLSNGSPAGNGFARGPFSREGSPGSYCSRGIGQTNSTFDVRGLTSHAMVMWVRLNEGLAQPFCWSVWGFAAANHQSWVLHCRAGVSGSPQFTMYDGLTLNMSLSVKAFDAGSIDNTSWHMIGGGYNAATNTINCFWGDGSDSSGNTFHYQEAAGFVAGYAAGLLDIQGNNIGRFSSLNVPDFDIDHATHWKGRAFDEQDYLNHWQLNTGLAFSEFGADPGRGGSGGGDLNSAYQWYWMRKRGLILP